MPRGTNSRGNSYSTPGGRNTSGGSSYHYFNTNGSYYYSNDNSSTYYNSGSGSATYAGPGGQSTTTTSQSSNAANHSTGSASREPDPPKVVEGYEYHTYAKGDPRRYVYIGRDMSNNGQTRAFLDYGKKAEREQKIRNHDT
ncbi:hypothetical protein TrLO_g3554 [Triparma laevis f. longispina]|uniref:Uncharacterized protein n=1 Tax=Triparma laevis f. longispina TaxID=1714387 RepID=A0A9W6ZGX6_9STRA|nr:hypothetical protein TrLO_g3554 [Triparma laevis f. longispina]